METSAASNVSAHIAHNALSLLRALSSSCSLSLFFSQIQSCERKMIISSIFKVQLLVLACLSLAFTIFSSVKQLIGQFAYKNEIASHCQYVILKSLFFVSNSNTFHKKMIFLLPFENIEFWDRIRIAAVAAHILQLNSNYDFQWKINTRNERKTIIIIIIIIIAEIEWNENFVSISMCFFFGRIFAGKFR